MSNLRGYRPKVSDGDLPTEPNLEGFANSKIWNFKLSNTLIINDNKQALVRLSSHQGVAAANKDLLLATGGKMTCQPSMMGILQSCNRYLLSLLNKGLRIVNTFSFAVM